MQLQCWYCGKTVSNHVPDSTVFRATATCPECEQKKAERPQQCAPNEPGAFPVYRNPPSRAEREPRKDGLTVDQLCDAAGVLELAGNPAMWQVATMLRQKAYVWSEAERRAAVAKYREGK